MSGIRVVFYTQYLENYGAHDWNGEGECPQYWKSKGGDAYIVSASAEELASEAWWNTIENSLIKDNDYEREYIVSHVIVDAIDFQESDYVDFWHAPTYALVEGDKLVCRREMLNWVNQVVGIRRWEQDSEGNGNFSVEEFDSPVVEGWRERKEMEMHGIDEQFEELCA